MVILAEQERSACNIINPSYIINHNGGCARFSLQLFKKSISRFLITSAVLSSISTGTPISFQADTLKMRYENKSPAIGILNSNKPLAFIDPRLVTFASLGIQLLSMMI